MRHPNRCSQIIPPFDRCLRQRPAPLMRGGGDGRPAGSPDARSHDTRRVDLVEGREWIRSKRPLKPDRHSDRSLGEIVVARSARQVGQDERYEDAHHRSADPVEELAYDERVRRARWSRGAGRAGAWGLGADQGDEAARTAYTASPSARST